MGRRFEIEGVVFDLDHIDAAHFDAGLTGGVLELWTTDGECHTFRLWTRDSAADFEIYAILKHESANFSESRPRHAPG